MGWLSLIVALPRLWTAQATAALVESHDRLITGAVEAHSSLASPLTSQFGAIPNSARGLTPMAPMGN